MRTQKIVFSIGIVLLLVSSAVAWAATPEPDEQRVPALGCSISDQTGPIKLPAAESIPIPAELSSIAAQMDYYKAEFSPGVFAPRGWHCHAWSGSNGTFLVITPRPIAPPFYPLPKITGPAVTISSWNGGSSGRFHVAIVAAQLFSVVGGDFIARVKQEHLIADSSFDRVPYPDDDLRYLSDRITQFTTPPNRSGLGTDGMLEMSNAPIKGLITLDLESELNAVTELRVRLPPNLNSVTAAIIKLETVCLQLQQGCRGLQ